MVETHKTNRMKTAEEILKEHTGHAHGLMYASVINAMKAYAKQVGEKVRQDCADNAQLEPNGMLLQVDRESILSTPITLD